uniref:NFATC2-interacting protein n=1 Tax=Amphilophus citrinellus TaxID=61819 RepID=A0A3Q0T5T9_AMPCI
MFNSTDLNISWRQIQLLQQHITTIKGKKSEEGTKKEKTGLNFYINFYSQISTGSELSVTAPLRSIFAQYVSKMSGSHQQTVRFHFDGSKVTGSQTPAQLDMEDGDIIEVWFGSSSLLPALQTEPGPSC